MKTLLGEDQYDDTDGGLESEKFLPSADGKKPVRFTDFEGKTSFGMSVFNLGNAIMGSGILGLAYAMANTGILLFLFLLTAVALLSCYSIHLMLKTSGIVGIRAYEELGYRAFGTPGKMAAGIAITLQNIGAMSSYLYIVKSELPLVIQAFLKADPNSDVCVILPLALMKQLGYLGYTSGFSLSCMVFFLTAVIYTELRNPTKKKMQKVSNVSIFVMYSMYFLAALFGYLTFYENVEPELLHTYSRIDPYDTLILCVRVAVLTAVTLTVPIVLFPVRRAIQHMIFPSKSFSWLRHISIALILLMFINMLVIFAPNILGIFGIIGATSAPCLIFIFPAVFYIRIVPREDEPLTSVPKIIALCFTAMGVSFMVMSLSFIFMDWTSGTSRAAGGH
uniref:Amino acid transporter transmembrane domain-containing protein n=1 Tax=Nothobranchius kuhntae TaxID=321403 RepID=A0A1A8J7S1_NOTKU